MISNTSCRDVVNHFPVENIHLDYYLVLVLMLCTHFHLLTVKIYFLQKENKKNVVKIGLSKNLLLTFKIHDQPGSFRVNRGRPIPIEDCCLDKFFRVQRMILSSVGLLSWLYTIRELNE